MNVNIITNENAGKFLQMLAWIEFCCHAGHSTDFNVGVDGDGGADLSFEFTDKDTAAAYAELKQEIVDQYNATNTDIKGFTFD